MCSLQHKQLWSNNYCTSAIIEIVFYIGHKSLPKLFSLFKTLLFVASVAWCKNHKTDVTKYEHAFSIWNLAFVLQSKIYHRLLQRLMKYSSSHWHKRGQEMWSRCSRVGHVESKWKFSKKKKKKVGVETPADSSTVRAKLRKYISCETKQICMELWEVGRKTKLTFT